MTCTCQTNDSDRPSCPDHGNCGWAIITQGRDGSWKIDWDGEFHTDFDAARLALTDAIATGCSALLCTVVPVELETGGIAESAAS